VGEESSLFWICFAFQINTLGHHFVHICLQQMK
jgi:hypothetical protein